MKNIIIAIVASITLSTVSVAESSIDVTTRNNIIADAIENGVSRTTFLLPEEELYYFMRDYVRDDINKKRIVLHKLVKLHAGGEDMKSNDVIIERACSSVKNFNTVLYQLPYTKGKTRIVSILYPDQFMDNLTDLEVHFIYNEFWTNLKEDVKQAREDKARKELEELEAREELKFKENHPILYFIKHL